jgi:DNA invertase Pin-like site-specific DNA recombinase
VRGGADRKKFGEALDDAEEDGQQVVVQKQIPRCARNDKLIRRLLHKGGYSTAVP